MIYASGRYDVCETTVELSREDRRPLTETYKSILSDGVVYFDPHDALCHDGLCTVYDASTHALLYTDSSPHFPASHPAPLTKEWKALLSKLPSPG